jgi:cytochrome c peroxidase
VRAKDEAEKASVIQRQQVLLKQRYDLSDKTIPGVTMSGGNKPVQDGIRVKLPSGIGSWEELAAMSPQEIRRRNLLPEGFKPLPHVKQATGGQVFPKNQIDEIQKQESRNLQRFDVDFDLLDRFTPEFPPPLYLTTHPELGDVSRGRLLTIKNYYEIMNGLITPVQMEGLRLLLTPFPQEEFNQTEDRKVADPSLGVTCLDCHANFHTNAAFHLTPDVRPRDDGADAEHRRFSAGAETWCSGTARPQYGDGTGIERRSDLYGQGSMRSVTYRQLLSWIMICTT